jgi:MFS transporter, DHA1 family, multidrug resistance protein
MRHIINFIKSYEHKHWHIAMLSLFHLLIAFARGALFAYIPKFVESFVVNVGLVGLILSIPWFLNIFNDIFIGNLSKKTSKKRLIILSITMLFSVGIIYYVSSSLLAVIIGLLIYGFACDLYIIPTYAQLIQVSPKKNDSESFAIFDSAGSLGWALGPMVGGFIIASYMPENIFLFFSLMCLFTFIFVIALIKIPDIKDKKAKETSLRVYFTNLVNIRKLTRQAKISLFLTSLLALWDSLLWMITPLYLFSLGTNPILIGIILTVFALPYLLFQIPAGFWEDKNGKAIIILPCMTVVGICFLGFSFFTAPLVLIILAFILSTASSILSPALGGMLMDNTPSSRRDENASLQTILSNFTIIIGYIVGGIIAEYFGYTTVYLIFGLLIFAVGLIMHFLHDDVDA